MTSSSSSSSSSFPNSILAGLGNLIKLLPTGTVFVFHFLSPLLSDNGRCGSAANEYLTGVLLVLCGASCLLSSFTDGFSGSDGVTRYGFTTAKGLWPGSSSSSAAYKLRHGDFLRALLSFAVFSVLSLLDSNVVRCFYPSWETSLKALLVAAPPAVGAVASLVFALFPGNRNGIGYPPSSSTSTSGSHRVSCVNV